MSEPQFPYDKPYKVLEAIFPNSLARQVCTHVEHGYIIAGGMSMFEVGDGFMCYQAVARIPECEESKLAAELLFSQRQAIGNAADAWCKRHNAVLGGEGIMAFLESEGLLNTARCKSRIDYGETPPVYRKLEPTDPKERDG